MDDETDFNFTESGYMAGESFNFNFGDSGSGWSGKIYGISNSNISRINGIDNLNILSVNGI